MKPNDFAPFLIFVFCNAICLLLYLAPHSLISSTVPVLVIETANIISVTAAPATTYSGEVSEENVVANENLVFVGDIMLARHVEYLMSKNGYNYPFLGSSFLTEKPAYVIGNFEATIPTIHKKTPNFTYQFSVDKQYLPGLIEAGFTHLSLANNHSLDYGYDGYKNAELQLTSLGITTFGQPKSYGENTISYISASNTKYALIGLNATLMDINEADLVPVIKEAVENSEVQIVYIHWGEEYTYKPNQSQRTIASFLARAGVDLIVGHHPHVIQSIEKIGNTLVFYSLGNFVFDQYFSVPVMQGLAISLAKDSEELEITLWPHSSQESHAQPNQLDGTNRSTVLNEIADYSDKNIAEMIKAGVIFTPLALATSTEIAIMNR